jgi:iron complex transport system permease protein
MTARLLLLLVLAAGAALLSIGTGAAALPPATVLEALTGGGDATTRTIVIDLRLPRVALALVAGGALALAGAVFQALLRNPLAEPYVLGVAGGAAVGAVAAVVLGLSVLPGVVQAAAFAGAVGAMLLVLRIAVRVGHALDTRVLLLAGVVVGAFFNAVILLLLMLADVESFRSAVFWMMGSLAGRAGVRHCCSRRTSSPRPSYCSRSRGRSTCSRSARRPRCSSARASSA